MAKCNINCTCSSISFLIFQIINLGLIITIMIISSYIYEGGDVSSAIAEELIVNFASVPITDFDQMDSINDESNSLRNLKESLGLTPVNFGFWQGTVKGCGKLDKDNKASVKRLDDDQNCESDEEVLNSIPSRYLRSYYGIKLSQSTVGKSYYELLYQEDSIVSKNEACPETKKSCGYIDTLNNKLCIDKDDNCPINYVKIDTKQPENIHITKTFSGKGRNMYISNNPYSDEKQNPHIIAAFKIADEKICTIPNLYWSKYPLFVLDGSIKKYSTNCIISGKPEIAFETDDRFHQIDLIKIYDLYKENGIIEAIQKSNLMKYGFNFDQEYGEKELYLYVRRFYGFDKKCLNEREKKFDINQLEDLEKKHTTSEKMKVWSIAVKVILAISEASALLNFINFTDISCGVDFWVKNVVSMVFSIVSLVYTCIANNFDDAFQDKFTCSDTITNEIFNIMIKKVQDSGFYIKITNYFIIANLVVVVILFILHICMESGDKN